MKGLRRKKKEILIPPNFDALLEAVKQEFTQMLRVNLNIEPFSVKEKRKRMKKREEIRLALRTCGSGEEKAKILVKDYIRRILLSKFKINEDSISQFVKEDVDFQFKMLLQEESKRCGKSALSELIDWIMGQNYQKREVDETDIENAFYEKIYERVCFPQKLDYLCQKIYERYRGNGVVDELLDMNVDGISGGVSAFDGGYSVWIMNMGRTIRLSFLKFKREEELKRVCRNLCKGNGIGQLSEKKGYLVAELKDGSRVAVARPPFSESWNFFVRKFRDSNFLEIEDIVKGKGDYLLIQLLEYLILGGRLFAITGEQGSGKTTLLSALIKLIPQHLNLRISEMSYELHLRKRYPMRNIVTYRETDTIGIQEGLDFTKKTDGNVTIIGEVATMQAVNFLVQVAQNASSFTLFTHHAKDTKSLIHYFRNSLLLKGNFQDERIALDQAVQSIRFNLKVGKNSFGERYIEKITEIIPSNSQEGFYEKDIISRVKDSYVLKNELSEETKAEIYARILSEDRADFLEFLRNWKRK